MSNLSPHSLLCVSVVFLVALLVIEANPVEDMKFHKFLLLLVETKIKRRERDHHRLGVKGMVATREEQHLVVPVGEEVLVIVMVGEEEAVEMVVVEEVMVEMAEGDG